MFESMTDRIAGTLIMGLDVAVEFATLGEFRLVEADGSPAPDLFQPAPLVRRPARSDATALDRQLMPPASTAIARAAAESAERAAARRRRPAGIPLHPGARSVLGQPARRRAAAAVPAARGASRTAARKRGGAVDAGAQLCLSMR